MRLLRALLLGLLLCAPLIGEAATVTHAVATADTGATPNTSGAFTPALNDLLVAMVVASDTQQVTATLTSSVGGFTFTQAGAFCGYNSNQNAIYFFVADALVSSATSQTVTFDTASDAATGTNIMVAAVAGVTQVGLSAIRQVSSCDFGAGGATGDPVFGVAVLTGNPTLGALGNASNPAGVTPPTNWTEAADIGYATPTIGGEYVYRDSGFTGTTFSWVSTFGSAGGAIAVEVAATTIPVFSAGPAAGTITSTTIPTTFTLNETGTVHGTACLDGQAGSQAETKLGQCTGGAAAPSSWSEAVVANVGDSHTFSGLTPSTKYDLTFSGTGTTLDTAGVSSIADQTTTCGGTPSITSVDGDNSFDATDSSIAIVGTSLCITHATATVVLRDGSANDKTLTCSVWTDTSWTCAASGVGMGVVNGLSYGALTLRFTNDAGNLGTKAVTVTQPSGTIYAALSGGLVTLAWDDNGAPSRPYGYPNDLETTSQVALRNASGCTLDMLFGSADTGNGNLGVDGDEDDIWPKPDGSLVVDPACTSADWDFTRSGLYVGTVAAQTFSGIPPRASSFTINNRSYDQNELIVPFDTSVYFVAGEAAISAYAWKQATTSTNRTLEDGAVTASLLLTVDAVTNLIKDDYIMCGTSGPARIKYVDPFNRQLGLWNAVTCADNAQIAERGLGAGAVTGLSYNTGTGIFTGTPTVLGTTSELFLRATDATSQIGDTNAFAITIRVPSVPIEGNLQKMHRRGGMRIYQ